MKLDAVHKISRLVLIGVVKTSKVVMHAEQPLHTSGLSLDLLKAAWQCGMDAIQSLIVAALVSPALCKVNGTVSARQLLEEKKVTQPQALSAPLCRHQLHPLQQGQRHLLQVIQVPTQHLIIQAPLLLSQLHHHLQLLVLQLNWKQCFSQARTE